MLPKVKLVLSGSGMLYPVHAGAVMALHELGFQFSEIVGTSGGSIIAACLAAGYRPDQLPQLIKDTLPVKNKLVDYSLFRFFTQWGLVDGSKLEKLLNEKLHNKTFCETYIPLHVVTTNSTLQRRAIFSTYNTPEFNIAKAVRASCSIPLVFNPVEIDNMLFTDGGTTSNFLIDLFNEDGKGVIGLRFAPKPKTTLNAKPKGLIEYIMAHVDTMIESATKEHIEDAPAASVIFLSSSFNSLNFKITDNDVDNMIEDGKQAVYRWVKGDKK